MNFRLKFLCALKHENRNILSFASLVASLFLVSAGEKILLNENFPGCGICETDDRTIEGFLRQIFIILEDRTEGTHVTN